MNNLVASNLKNIYNHIMAISDSKQLDKETIGKTLVESLAELTKMDMKPDEYREKYLIQTSFGYVKLCKISKRVECQSSFYTKEYFYTMDEILETAPKYEAFAELVDNKIISGLV